MAIVQVRCWMKGCINVVDDRTFDKSIKALGLIPARGANTTEKRGKKTNTVPLSCPTCRLGAIYIPDCGAMMPHVGMWAVRDSVTDMNPKLWEEHDFLHRELSAWLKAHDPALYQIKYSLKQDTYERGFSEGFKAGWLASEQKGETK